MKKIPVGDSGAKSQLNGRISCKTETFSDINPWDCGSCPCPWHGLGMGYLRSLPIWNSLIFTSGLGGFPPLLIIGVEGAVAQFQRGWSWDSSGMRNSMDSAILSFTCAGGRGWGRSLWCIPIIKLAIKA